jgi:hypothetical protein
VFFIKEVIITLILFFPVEITFSRWIIRYPTGIYGYSTGVLSRSSLVHLSLIFRMRVLLETLKVIDYNILYYLVRGNRLIVGQIYFRLNWAGGCLYLLNSFSFEFYK